MTSARSRPDLDRISGQALRAVLGTLLGVAEREVTPVHGGPAQPSDGILLATVQLAGQRVAGLVRLGISRSFAARAVVRLTGGEAAGTDHDAATGDFAGELCNMLAGRVAAGLRAEGYPCGLSTPQVVRDPGRLPEPEPGADCSRTDWSCQGQPLTLELQCHYRPT